MVKYLLALLILPALSYGTVVRDTAGYNFGGGDNPLDGVPYDLPGVYHGMIIPVPNDSTTIVVDSVAAYIAYRANTGDSPAPNQTLYLCDSAAGTLLATSAMTTTYEADLDIYGWLRFGTGSIATLTDTTQKMAVGFRSQAVGGTSYTAIYGSQLNAVSGWTKFSRTAATAPTALGTVTYDANDALAIEVYYHYGVAPVSFKARRRRLIGLLPKDEYKTGVITVNTYAESNDSPIGSGGQNNEARPCATGSALGWDTERGLFIRDSQ